MHKKNILRIEKKNKVIIKGINGKRNKIVGKSRRKNSHFDIQILFVRKTSTTSDPICHRGISICDAKNVTRNYLRGNV